MPASLTLELGFAAPTEIDVDPERILRLGRNRTNDVVLHDQHASRYHAEIYYESKTWYLRDLGTTNGSRVNGAKIGKDPVPLEHGDLIGIGEVRLRFNSPQVSNSGVNAVRTPPQDLPISVPSCDATTFEADDLTALVQFINAAVLEATPNGLVHHALRAIYQQIRPVLCCFQSLDRLSRLDPVSRLVLPSQVAPNVDMLKDISTPVRESKRPLWVKSRLVSAPLEIDLHGYSDALCIPLASPEEKNELLGLLFAFLRDRRFTDRQVHFCQIVSDSMAHHLQAQRIRRTLEADNLRFRGVRMSGRSEQMVGRSERLNQLRLRIRKLADGVAPVLIHGPTGAGKELVALDLHKASRRNAGPFIEVNCAAIPVELAESQFFGHVAGAFSGAVADHAGHLQQADEGILFLDEVADLHPKVQGKLLRLFERKDNRISFLPVGGQEPVNVSVRIVAATHRDLGKLVEENRFREDLYFRLSVTSIEVPALEQHAEDIPDLVSHFLERLNLEYYRLPDQVTISEEAVAHLRRYSWPGNVRQLRAVLEQAVAMSEPGDRIEIADLCLPTVDRTTVQMQQSPTLLPTLNMEELESMAIQAAIEQTKTMVEAAALLGIHRDTLRTKWERIQRQNRGVQDK